MASPFVVRVFRGDDLLRTEQFNRDIVKIGRLATAHLVLDEDGIARIHAVIEVAPGGALSIIDMGSAGGTVVNGKKVSRAALQFGDIVTIGHLKLVIDAAEGAEEPAAEPAAAPEPPAPAPVPAAAAPAPRTTGAGMAAVKAPAPRTTAAGMAAAVAPAPRTTAAGLPAAKPAPAAPAPRTTAAGIPAAKPAPAARAAKPAAPPPPAEEPVDVPIDEPASPAPAARAAAPAKAVRPMKVAETVHEDLSGEGDLGVELRVLWGDTLIEAGTFIAPKQPVLAGESVKCALRITGAHFPVPEFPILRYAGGEYRFAFARGMTGVVEEGGKRTTLAALVRERKAAADDKVDGAFTVSVPKVGAVRAEIGSRLAVEARPRKRMEVKGGPFWERINYQFLNLFLVLFFLQGAFVVATENFPYDTDVVADDLFKNPARMAKFIVKPAEQQKMDLPKADKKEDTGEAAEKHKGEEGQMGKKDAPKTDARSAPKAIDPNAKEVVKRSGLLGAMGRGGGGGLSTIFGQGGLGGDLKGAVGNMYGPVVGDSYGLGGLGIRGSGSGGGGSGETIGIGGVGTKGRGGGLGGYGSGAGGLGRKGERDVNITTGQSQIMGSIDKELVRKVIQEHAAQIRYCYEQQLALNPKLSGKVSVKWTINADGSATAAIIDAGATTLNDAKVHECMKARIMSWEFPKPKGGGMAIITYPWILRSSGGEE
jgi:hypothetical protein